MGITLLYYINICIPVIWYLSLIYLVYLIILIPCIPSCLAITISLEQVMREDIRHGELLNSLVYML
jgi:hypothetical protein